MDTNKDEKRPSEHKDNAPPNIDTPVNVTEIPPHEEKASTNHSNTADDFRTVFDYTIKESSKIDWNKLIAISSGVICLCNIILICITFKQTSDNEKQSIKSDSNTVKAIKIADRTSRAAMISANAANRADSISEKGLEQTKIISDASKSDTKKSIAIAETSLDLTKKSLKAYIVRNGSPKMLSYRVGDSIRVGIPYKNTGETPAFNSNQYSGSNSATGMFPSDKTVTKNTFAQNITIQPKEEWVFNVTTKIKLGYADSLIYRMHAQNFFCFGYVTFDDAFGGKDTSRFCLKYLPEVDDFEFCDEK